MTPVESLPAAGRVLDEQVAAMVMSWEQCKIPEHGPDCSYWWETDGLRHGHTLPDFSTDIAAAWEVVEKMRSDPRPRFRNLSMTAYCYNRTYATFDAEAITEYTPESWAEANGEHATPLAICRAALKAVAP